MTKADLIKALADMPDNAILSIHSVHSSFNIRSIDLSRTKELIWIILEYMPEVNK